MLSAGPLPLLGQSRLSGLPLLRPSSRTRHAPPPSLGRADCPSAANAIQAGTVTTAANHAVRMAVMRHTAAASHHHIVHVHRAGAASTVQPPITAALHCRTAVVARVAVASERRARVHADGLATAAIAESAQPQRVSSAAARCEARAVAMALASVVPTGLAWHVMRSLARTGAPARMVSVWMGAASVPRASPVLTVPAVDARTTAMAVATATQRASPADATLDSVGRIALSASARPTARAMGRAGTPMGTASVPPAGRARRASAQLRARRRMGVAAACAGSTPGWMIPPPTEANASLVGVATLRAAFPHAPVGATALAEATAARMRSMVASARATADGEGATALNGRARPIAVPLPPSRQESGCLAACATKVPVRAEPGGVARRVRSVAARRTACMACAMRLLARASATPAGQARRAISRRAHPRAFTACAALDLAEAALSAAAKRAGAARLATSGAARSAARRTGYARATARASALPATTAPHASAVRALALGRRQLAVVLTASA